MRSRAHEIGIRVALGARQRDVLGMVVKQGMGLPLVGIVIGLTGAFAVTRLMKGLLFEVGASDPATFTRIVLILIVVALMACLVPARRTTKVNPTVALRSE